MPRATCRCWVVRSLLVKGFVPESLSVHMGLLKVFFLLSTMGFNMRGRCFTFSPIEVSNQIYDIGSFEDKI